LGLEADDGDVQVLAAPSPTQRAAAWLPIAMTKLHNLTDTNQSTRVAWAETRFLFRKLVRHIAGTHNGVQPA
jgi:hypothetical protein